MRGPYIDKERVYIGAVREPRRRLPCTIRWYTEGAMGKPSHHAARAIQSDRQRYAHATAAIYNGRIQASFSKDAPPVDLRPAGRRCDNDKIR